MTYPFPTEEEVVEAWTAALEVLDNGIIEDVKGIHEAMQKLYGRPPSKEEMELAQLILVTVAKSTFRLTQAIINTYLCTDRGRSEMFSRMRERSVKPSTPDGKPEDT